MPIRRQSGTSTDSPSLSDQRRRPREHTLRRDAPIVSRWPLIRNWSGGELRQFRAVATRYDERDFMYQATVDVASIWIWLRDPVP